jgi:preprotein translocase subunit SecD
MTRNNKIVLFVIILIFAFTFWIVYPFGSDRLGRNGLRLGLDLVGGVQLVYQAQVADNATSADLSSAVDRAVLTIGKRIDTYGVTEPIIQKIGENRIMIQLPGFTDLNAAKSLVEQTGFMEFRVVEQNAANTVVTLKDYLAEPSFQFIKATETGSRFFTINGNDTKGGASFQTVAILKNNNGVLTMTDAAGNPADNKTLSRYSSATSWVAARSDDGIQLTGAYLADAQTVLDTSSAVSKPAVNIKWDAEGGAIFDQIAARIHNPQGSSGSYSLQYAIGIFLDNNLLSAPQILQASYGGSGEISGSFTQSEAKNLANLLKSGALPVQLIKPPLYQEKVSATLGAKFIDKSKLAGLIGMLLVMAYMIIYYRLPGVLASLALIFYGTLSLTVFKLIPVTLSLAGLGGFIASLGMAVDANVLIFERMKEELRLGRTLGASVEAGFHRAWSAIRDSNLTTILACVILYWLGSTVMASSAVKGFALTLGIGVLLSMFTAITVTRTFLRSFIGSKAANNSFLFYSGGGKKK